MSDLPPDVPANDVGTGPTRTESFRFVLTVGILSSILGFVLGCVIGLMVAH